MSSAALNEQVFLKGGKVLIACRWIYGSSAGVENVLKVI